MPTQHHGLFCPSPHPTSEQPGGAPGTERGHSQDSWPQLAKGISHTVRRRAQQIKLVEEGKGGHSEWWHLSSQVAFTWDGALLSWRWLNSCLPAGSSEWVPYFSSVACTAFAFPIKLPWSIHEVSHFYPSDSLPPPTAGERASGCLGFSCWLGLKHDRSEKRKPQRCKKACHCTFTWGNSSRPLILQKF